MPSRASSENSASSPGVPGALMPMVLPARSASALTESFFAAGTRSATGGAAVRPKTSRGGALPAWPSCKRGVERRGGERDAPAPERLRRERLRANGLEGDGSFSSAK